MPIPSYRADLFINGEWRAGSSGERFNVIDPSDGSTVAAFAIATDADCIAAMDAARDAGPAWAATAPRVRGEILRKAWELLTAEKDQLTEVIVRENGKSWADAATEATYSTEFFRWFSEEAVRVRGDYRQAPAGDKRIIVTHQPIGVSLLITPWNFPAAMASRKLGPALAAGCTVVLKPATETPLTSAYIVDALQRAGVPAGVVNLVTPGKTGPAVEAMMQHPSIRKLSFTGSTEVGRVLLKQAAESVINCSMELGGNAPLIVLPGADLDLAVEGALLAKMRNGGSACTSANRLYVHRSLHEEFVAKLTAGLQGFRTGPGLERSNTLGALVSVKERNKVADLVDTAVAEGASVVLGGHAPSEGDPLGGGAFYPPTVLTDVAHGSTINQTEIFGPVSAVVVFDEVDDAVRMANDTIFGLISYVFGEEGLALRVAERMESGMVGVNKGVLSDPAAPFGGMKQSGLGREGSSDGILEFLEEKYIALPA